jgi:putative ATP-binding cassette transporter
MTALDAVERSEPSGPSAVARHAPSGIALQLCNVSVTLEDGRPIVGQASATISAGERVLIAGNSGSGKSSLMRTVAGCWPWSGGEILLGRGHRLLVVPQRPYVPTGTLREAVTYPLPVDGLISGSAEHALSAAGLAQFLSEIDTVAPWETILSEGEKQRLAIARVLLHRPDIIALDEATSALHVAGQADIMGVVARELPHATIISVGHRPELESFHARKLTLATRPGGASIVADTPIRKPQVVSLPPSEIRASERPPPTFQTRRGALGS